MTQQVFFRDKIVLLCRPKFSVLLCTAIHLKNTKSTYKWREKIKTDGYLKSINSITLYFYELFPLSNKKVRFGRKWCNQEDGLQYQVQQYIKKDLYASVDT